MIKEMTINISVSGETDGECDYSLIEALTDIQDELTVSDKSQKVIGNLDKSEEESMWSYEIKTINAD